MKLEPGRILWISAAVLPLLSPLFYLLLGPSTPGAIASSVPLLLSGILLALRDRSPWRFVTWPMRIEATLISIALAAAAYFAIGWPILAVSDLLATSKVLPLFEPSILRFMVLWPFYVWLLIGCQLGGFPCPEEARSAVEALSI